MTIHERIETIQREKRMGLSLLSEKTGIQLCTLQAMLRRRSSVSTDAAVKIADALEVGLSYLIRGEEETRGAIESAFTYHPPKKEQIPIYESIRARTKELAEYIDANCPDSREKSIALTKLEEYVMWANAAVARNT